MKRTIATCLALTISAAAGIGAANAQAPTLTAVKNRDQLNCGTGTGLAGLSLPDAQGEWSGIDVDLCRAVSAAILNDPRKVKFIPLTPKDRFTALQSGEIDVLSRGTTWTMSRETGLGVAFAGINFFDGQGFMVKKSLGVDSARKLDGASICVQQGTTTELNVADFARSNNIKYEPVTFEKNDELIKAFEANRCDALTNDGLALHALKLKLDKPDEVVVLPEIISKEPLGPFTRVADAQWQSVIKWVHYATINAEELGVTQANVDEMRKSTNPDIRRLLGVEGKFGEGIGLTNDWAYRIVKHVGNYGEIYERSIGAGSLLKIPRGRNALWSKGGLMFAPPIR
jgi:general L-amino acid transport system substrate-binding protein